VGEDVDNLDERRFGQQAGDAALVMSSSSTITMRCTSAGNVAWPIIESPR
jgi:hypothetical protein